MSLLRYWLLLAVLTLFSAGIAWAVPFPGSNAFPDAGGSKTTYRYYTAGMTAVGAAATQCLQFYPNVTTLACDTQPYQYTAYAVKDGTLTLTEVTCFNDASNQAAGNWDVGDNITMELVAIDSTGPGFTLTSLGTFNVDDDDIGLGGFTKSISMTHTFSAQGLGLRVNAVNQDTGANADWNINCVVR